MGFRDLIDNFRNTGNVTRYTMERAGRTSKGAKLSGLRRAWYLEGVISAVMDCTYDKSQETD